MSSTTDFIAELVRAANEVDRLTELEHARLLVRSVAAIREMREKARIPSVGTHTDKIADLQVLIAQIGIAADTPEEVRVALLTAAGMIRDLHIVLDTGTEIQMTESE